MQERIKDLERRITNALTTISIGVTDLRNCQRDLERMRLAIENEQPEAVAE